MKVKYVNGKSKIKDVAGRWKKQYFENEKWAKCSSNDSEAIYKELLTAKSAEEIAAIIGNDGWTRIGCDGCGFKVTDALALHEDDGTRIAVLCYKCLEPIKVALEICEEQLNESNNRW